MVIRKCGYRKFTPRSRRKATAQVKSATALYRISVRFRSARAEECAIFTDGGVWVAARVKCPIIALDLVHEGHHVIVWPWGAVTNALTLNEKVTS